MKRGELWTAAGGPDYAGKPRPVVIIQDNQFDSTSSITVCGLTTDNPPAPIFRLPVEPSERNALNMRSFLMVDKITTLPKGKLGHRIGRLDEEDIVRFNRAIAVFLGLAANDARA